MFTNECISLTGIAGTQALFLLRAKRKSQAQHEGEGQAGGQITPSVPRAGRDSPVILNTEQQDGLPEDLLKKFNPAIASTRYADLKR